MIFCKKTFCFAMVIVLFTTCIFSIYAQGISVGDNVISNQNDMPDIISKDMQTDEITYTSYSELMATYSHNIPAAPMLNFSLADPSIDLSSFIGPDNRTEVNDTTIHPYSAILYIESTFDENQNGNLDEQPYLGTAWMISENVAVTVAHNVYDTELNIWAGDIKAWPGRNGNTYPYGGPYKVTYMTMCSSYPSGIVGSDWALIAFDVDIGNSTGVIDFTYFSDTTLNGISLRISGYDEDETELDVGGVYAVSKQYQMIGTLSSFTSVILKYQVDTEQGQSGSPVMGLGHVAFGIHYEGAVNSSDPYNKGIRITQGIYNVFHSCIAEQALS